MPTTRTFKQAFSGGEVSPEMFGRIADNKFQQGAATMLNFIAKPQGPAQNRPGFAYVNAVKNSAKATRLLSFTFNTVQTMVIEMGDQYFRFHTQGQTLLYSAGSAWSNPPCAESRAPPRGQPPRGQPNWCPDSFPR